MNVTRRRRETRKRRTEGRIIGYACNCVKVCTKKWKEILDTKLLYTKSGPRYGKEMGRIPNWKNPVQLSGSKSQGKTEVRCVPDR